MNTRKSTMVFFSVMIAAAYLYGAGSATNEVPDMEVQRAKFKEIFEQMKPVTIYGKVIDITGSPIAGAEVKISWEQATVLIGHPDSGRFDLVQSDHNGCWEVTLNKPHRAFIADVRKLGYDYGSARNIDDDRNLIYKRTTKNNPVISILRKKGENTFLLRREGYQLIRVFSPQSQTNSMDLLAEKPDKPKSRSCEDVSVAVNYGGMLGKWTVTYSATNGTDGIVIGTNLLYEAPQEGYQKEIVLTCPPWPKHLYLRSRTPAIYSRLDLEHSTWKESETNEGFRISYKAWINPYGERNLEYDTDLEKEWRLADRLEDEAKTAFRQNKRPTKPDLPKLIKEAKEKAEKDKPGQ